jgi:metal-responsive CopG/Arc/MetJ family transcriptional regulator
MKRTSLFLDDKLLKALRRTAAREGVSVASIVREAVSRYLTEPESSPGSLPSVTGRFKSGKHDTATHTDKFLWRDPHV